MGKISDSDANDILDVMFGRIANPFPVEYFLALSTTLPTNTGTSVTEPSGGAYARVAFDNDTVTFPGAAARVTAIDIPIVFPEATADWGLITHFAIYDAITAGNFKGWGALGTPLNVVTGGIVTFAAGSLVISSPGV